MLRFLCCCFSSGDSADERQPLLHPGPSDLNEAGSARQSRSAHSDAQTVKRIGRLVMRRVCVPELDQRFSDMAETFNEQHERYEAMVRNIRNLRQSYSCNHNDTLALTKCVGMIRDEHKAKYKNEVKGISASAKATISKGTTLQELIGWLLRSKDQMAEQVKGAAATYQEHGRLSENLEENLKEVRRAKEFALGYRQRAGEVFTEAAQIAGAYL
ncbi:hypothetical protein KUCAC02_011445 [Chaenocephalus aceratus]|uniref:Uncharacterized protein n=1 Tax=Chaenocephalus aceratus TaxID=36190 RepID=A0ACB9WWN5_CHAAC|nr:hypothetical protein KUCAC02_011445 [Chaenocephalus aceratus]